ncbi:hypothetical protein BU23DRAFT_597876 [Bimuria novae-zelandiae CBS 107.79]|uniref:Uncharacterized protein n=1 Tax=Bimuria novae-zelandiae CBS 107.79 TaxID=1447943 RepID=A0A6A5VK16_9PLEO|nr:hypothetical protein BU23DRAFT_597876 [Bimuria novae-zelandiae CBS 107.79]
MAMYYDLFPPPGVAPPKPNMVPPPGVNITEPIPQDPSYDGFVSSTSSGTGTSAGPSNTPEAWATSGSLTSPTNPSTQFSMSSPPSASSSTSSFSTVAAAARPPPPDRRDPPHTLSRPSQPARTP